MCRGGDSEYLSEIKDELVVEHTASCSARARAGARAVGGDSVMSQDVECVHACV